MKKFLAFFLHVILGYFSAQAAIPSLQDFAARALIEGVAKRINFSLPRQELPSFLSGILECSRCNFFDDEFFDEYSSHSHTGSVKSICMMSNNCCITGDEDGLAKVWVRNTDLDVWQWTADIGGEHGHEEGIESLTRLDERTVLTATWNYSVKMWRYDDVTHEWRFVSDVYNDGQEIVAPQFIPFEDNHFVFWYPGCELTEICFYHYNELDAALVLEDAFIDLNDDGAEDVFIHAFAKIDEHHIALGCGNGDIKIFRKNADSHWEFLQNISAHEDTVFSLARLHSNAFVSGCYDHSVKIWIKDSVTHLWNLQESFEGEAGHHSSVDDIVVLNEAAFISVARDGVMKFSSLCPSTRNWLCKEYAQVPSAQKIVTSDNQIGFQSPQHFLFGFQNLSFDNYWPCVIFSNFLGKQITSFLFTEEGLLIVGFEDGLIVFLKPMFDDGYEPVEKIVLWKKLQYIRNLGGTEIVLHPTWMSVYHSLSVFHRCGVVAQEFLPDFRKRSYHGEIDGGDCKRLKRE